jgi:hypothetical protein
VCNETVRATLGVNVTLVLLTVLESIPIDIVRLIVLLTGTPVAALAGSEDLFQRPGLLKPILLTILLLEMTC